MSLYGMVKKELSFSDEEIANIFGHEAAEDEDPKRLKEYYLKSELYEQMAADLPLRIIVGHKGIGKSAMFQVLKQELDEKNELSINITPDDIIDIDSASDDFLILIRSWKNGLSDLIVNKVIENLGVFNDKIPSVSGDVLNVLYKILNKDNKFDLDDEKEKIFFKFLENKKITIFIDDLDRGWEGKVKDIKKISAMLNAVRDISRANKQINFKVSLRSDVYYLFRTSDESTDKVEGSVVWLSWTNHQILALLTKRIITYFSGSATEYELLKKKQYQLSKVLDFVFNPTFEGKGKWEDIPTYRLLMSLIRKRPRDLVKLCTLSAKEARKNRRSYIGTSDLNNVFESYSQGRLQDTYLEYRSELPDIEKLLISMKPTTKEKRADLSYLFTNDRLYKKVQNIQNGHKFIFANGNEASCKQLCAFMYKINFITGRKNNKDEIVRKYYEEQRYLMNQFTDFGFSWEIHPAYRWALEPDNIDDILKSLELSRTRV